MKNFNSFTLNLHIILFSLFILMSCSREEIDADLVQKETARQPEMAFPNTRGEITTIEYNGEKVQVEKINDQYVLEGDMIVSPDCDHDHSKALGRTSYRWPQGIVVYDIESGLPNQSRVYNAISHWEQNTPIRFVRRTTQTDYVLFKYGSGCSSAVGKIGGKQNITLANGCTEGTVIHEIGHAVGLWHEQSRGDRDQFINIISSNIIPGYEHNFQKRTYGTHTFSPFDFGSIMMYHPKSFSKNGQPTITLKNGNTYSVNQSVLSPQDIEGVRHIYCKSSRVKLTGHRRG